MASQSPFSFPNIEDKLQFLKECIEQVEDQLLKRRQQKQEIISELEEKLCEVQSVIYYLEQPGLIKLSLLSRRRVNLDKEIKNLEREKRAQEVEYWRDVVGLQKELRQLKKEYRAVKQSMGAFSCSEQKKS